MALEIKTREQFVADMIAAIQAATPNTYLFPVGSITRALVDASAEGIAMWEQSLIQLVYNRERLSTSTGADVDSFLADFGLKRQAAVAATGNVIFASYTDTTQRIVPVGAQVTTQDGTVIFEVYADANNSNYNAGLNGYVLAAGIPSLSVPVRATTAGIIGNVAINTITVIVSPISGIDTVTNTAAFSSGQAPQGDPEARAYFVAYLNSLSKATKGALEFAIESVPDVTEYALVENTNYATGAEQLGYFYAIVSDATGNPTPDLLASVTNALDAVRGLSIRFDVFAPVLVNAAITATVTLPAGYSNPDLATLIADALVTYINLIPLGETLFYSRIYQIIYNAINAIAPSLIDEFNVSNVLLNGGTANLTTTPKQRITANPDPVITIV